MIPFDEKTKKELIKISSEKGVFLEGNILKLLSKDGATEFDEYLRLCVAKDKENRRKRLEITKTIQRQNRELTRWKNDNEKLNKSLKKALEEAEKAKDSAQADLNILQKKMQYELVELIVKCSLVVICCIGLITSVLFSLSLFWGIENKTLESSWSNMFGIMLTNSFSIVGTIMGVKYATEKKAESSTCNYKK